MHRSEAMSSAALLCSCSSPFSCRVDPANNGQDPETNMRNLLPQQTRQKHRAFERVFFQLPFFLSQLGRPFQRKTGPDSQDDLQPSFLRTSPGKGGVLDLSGTSVKLQVSKAVQLNTWFFGSRTPGYQELGSLVGLIWTKTVHSYISSQWRAQNDPLPRPDISVSFITNTTSIQQLDRELLNISQSYYHPSKECFRTQRSLRTLTSSVIAKAAIAPAMNLFGNCWMTQDSAKCAG